MGRGAGPWRMGTVATIAAAALAAAGCTVPLGPGYTIEQQRLEAAVVRSPEPHVDVHASWRVKNTGDRPLRWLDVEVPDAETHGLGGLRIESGGAEVVPGHATYGSAVRIPFEQPLEIKSRREIAVSYSLAGGAGVVAEDAGFALPPGDWAPVLLPPEGQGAFARGSDPPKKWDMTVRVPTGFRVYASGHEHGQRNEGQDVEFRYQERRGGGLPYAAGGAYQEERIALQSGAVILWTRQAMPQGLAERVAAAAEWSATFYNQAFGILGEKAWAVRVIECVSREDCWAVPRAALLRPELFATDFGTSGVREMNRQLARTWLDFRVHPDWSEEPYPMSAVADYAADLAAAGSGAEGARRRILHERMEDFNRLELPERAIAPLNVRMTDSPAVRRYAEFQSELFFFALEDEAGSENVQRGLKHLLGTYAGGVWRATDLRSAVELECGKDLGPLFRQWLTEPGIPREFRRRYGGVAEGAQGASEEQ